MNSDLSLTTLLRFIFDPNLMNRQWVIKDENLLLKYAQNKMQLHAVKIPEKV